jgi:hypothetical protein
MTDRIHVVGLVVSVALLAVVLELVRRRKLSEEYSFLWILFAAALVALSLRRDILHAAARWLGIYYPPIVLVLVLILMVFVAALAFSVIVSRQRRQIERLIEETAVLSAEIEELRAQQAREPASDSIVQDRIGPRRSPSSRAARQ